MAVTNGAIIAEDIRKNYGHIEALRGLTLAVHEGEIFGLLGANGAGKTTLIKTLIGVIRPNSGTARVLGFDPVRQAYDLRSQIGYMPQSPALYEDLSARDNVRFFANARKVDHLADRIDEVMAFINLSDRQNDPVYGFSGGMKQRVSLACALVHKPRLLFLDEPSTGVDPKLRESLWSHFRELAAEGATILLSTHQMDEAFHCDRVGVMRQGVLLASDTPRGLMARGKAKVSIWRGGQVQTEVVSHYADQLPQMLGLDSSVTRIEIQEETLEDVVLHLIDERTSASASETT
jgi:ABC-2 type transport system ATP-binding protein